MTRKKRQFNSKSMAPSALGLGLVEAEALTRPLWSASYFGNSEPDLGIVLFFGSLLDEKVVAYANVKLAILNKSECVGPIFAFTFWSGWGVLAFHVASFVLGCLHAPFPLAVAVAMLCTGSLMHCQMRILSHTLLPSLQMGGRLRVFGYNKGTSAWFAVSALSNMLLFHGDFALAFAAGKDGQPLHTLTWLIPQVGIAFILLTQWPRMGEKVCAEVGNPDRLPLAYHPRWQLGLGKTVLAATVHFVSEVVGFSMVGTTTLDFISAKVQQAVNVLHGSVQNADDKEVFGRDLVGHASSLRRRAFVRAVVDLFVKRLVQLLFQSAQVRHGLEDAQASIFLTSTAAILATVLTLMWFKDALSFTEVVHMHIKKEMGEEMQQARWTRAAYNELIWMRVISSAAVLIGSCVVAVALVTARCVVQRV